MDSIEKKLHDTDGGLILDVASGTGGFTKFVADNIKSFESITGIDQNIDRLITAEKKLSRDKIEFVTMDAARMGFADQTFDMVTISNSLHHLKAIPETLAEMKRVLKTGGTFIVCEVVKDNLSPNQMLSVDLHHWWAEIDRLVGVVHNETFTRNQLIKMIEKINLADIISFEEIPEEDPDEYEEEMKIIMKTFAEYPERIKNHPEYSRLKAKGQKIKEQIDKEGLSWATHLNFICKK